MQQLSPVYMKLSSAKTVTLELQVKLYFGSKQKNLVKDIILGKKHLGPKNSGFKKSFGTKKLGSKKYLVMISFLSEQQAQNSY